LKKISEILINIKNANIVGDDSYSVSSLCYDSRLAKNGSMFFAIRGTQTDGHNYIENVVSQGTKIVVCETFPASIKDDVCYIKVEDSSVAMGFAASAFYDNPSSKIKLIGITGTNGKTTVATLLFNLFKSFGHGVGLLSTVQNQINERIIPSTHTTPDSIKINEMLRQMLDEGCEYCFMEVSSHAIEQNRVKGLIFNGALFTNITHDHLDYHLTFDNYIKAKKKLFDNLDIEAFSLSNKDDRNGTVMLQNSKSARYYFSLKALADFKAKIIEKDFNGMLLNIDGDEVWFKLVGTFNAYNILAVYGCAFLMGKEKHEILTRLSMLNAVKGRFEYLKSHSGIIGIVDYSHTPDALKNILNTINEIRSGNEQLITIVGCGGNRDKEKRPIMANVASQLSTKAIFTSDNPRNENPEIILDEMQKGVPAINHKKTLRISDRAEAIKTAVSISKKNDIILIAGKGHENYQEIAGVKHHFDDRETLEAMFKIFD